MEIEQVIIEGQDIDCLNMRWNEISVPKMSRLSPGKSCMLIFAVDNQVVFGGSHLANFDDWKSFEIHLYDQRNLWLVKAEIISPVDGNLKIRRLKTLKKSG